MDERGALRNIPKNHQGQHQRHNADAEVHRAGRGGREQAAPNFAGDGGVPRHGGIGDSRQTGQVPQEFPVRLDRESGTGQQHSHERAAAATSACAELYDQSPSHSRG